MSHPSAVHSIGVLVLPHTVRREKLLDKLACPIFCCAYSNLKPDVLMMEPAYARARGWVYLA
jgi:hypothetical protein